VKSLAVLAALAALAAVIWLASMWRAFKAEKVLQQDLAQIREALADREIVQHGRSPGSLTQNMVRGDPGRARALG